MTYQYLKALHIIFVVTWFAGLFYFPRLLVYDVEARSESQAVREALLNRFRLMQKRLLFGIMWPSMILTLVLGSWLVIHLNIPLSETWLSIKISLVILLVVYQFSLQKFYNDFRIDRVRLSSNFLRMWNEIPTVLLFAIVFLVILKSTADMMWGIVFILLLILILLAAIRLYRYFRLRR
jgi:protoporphyrinogen IX oxidase